MIIGSCSCYSPNGPCPRLISPVFSHVWWAPDTKIELRSEWICGYVFCLPFSTIFVPNRRRSCQFSFHRTLGLLVKNDARMGLWNEVGLLKGFTKHSYFAFLSSLQVKTRFVSDILLLTRPPKTKKTWIHPPHHSIKGICLIQCCYIIPALEDNSSNPSASLHLSWSISTICQSCLIPPHTTVTSKLLRAAGSVFHNRKGHRPGLAIWAPNWCTHGPTLPSRAKKPCATSVSTRMDGKQSSHQSRVIRFHLLW